MQDHSHLSVPVQFFFYLFFVCSVLKSALREGYMTEFVVTGSHVNASALREFTFNYVRRCARP